MPLLSETLLRALLWTLLHSLWIGLLAAVLAGAVVAATRRLRPALRYNALLLVSAAFLLATALTFLHYFQDPQPGMATSISHSSEAARTSGQTKSVPVYDSWSHSLAGLADRNAALLVGLWAVLLAFRAIRLSVHYRALRTLRTQSLQPATAYWQAQLEYLGTRIGLRTVVPLFESGIARVPMIVGYLKPMLLVPAGFFSGLPAASVEAILLHELAHLRRRDHLVNGLQHLVELLFFFNPAVLWISRLLRTEREHCCDDLAVAHSGNSRSYIDALVAFQERAGAPVGALAFADREMPLLDRVKRLIHHQNKSLNTMEKTALIAGLLAVTLLGSAFYQEQQKQLPPPPPEAPKQINVAEPLPPLPPPPPPAVDTFGKRTGDIQYSDGKSTYRFTMENNQLVGVAIDGVAQPKEKIAGYEKMFRKVLKEAQRAEAEARVHETRAERLHVEAESLERRAVDLEQQSKELAAQAELLDARRAEHEKISQEHERMSKDHEATRRAHEQLKVEHVNIMKDHERLSKEHEKMAREHEKHAQVHALVQRELVKDGIIKGNGNISISFTGDSLIINGVTQPAAVAAKYRKLIADENARLGIKE